MPRLISFYEEHAADRDRFEIVAFHDKSAKTFEELDAKLKSRNIREKHWGGRDLPFPVLLDASGRTIKDYGIWYYPTVLLIDPQGNLVGEADQKLLGTMLRETKGAETTPPR